ncbi:CopG family transcriptional regulator [Sulfuracidifex tepidarius]|nr:CopG family transcriptional regulator [Sulfuracidifex tepidarius]
MVVGKDTSRIVVYLPKDIADNLEKEAEEKGLSLSAYIRMLILDYTKQKQNAMKNNTE